MPIAIKQECRILSIFALGLFFVSQNLGIYMTTVYRLPPEQVALVGGAHFGGVLVFAVLLATLAGRGNRVVVPLCLALCTLLIFVSHILHEQNGMLVFALRSAGVGVFWTGALHAFFLFAPLERRGLLLGLAVAAGELVWLVVLPGLNPGFPNAPGPELVGYAHKLQAVVQTIIGCALTMALAFGAARNGARTQNAAGAEGSTLPRAAIAPLFFAAALLYILYGLAGGASFPKVGRPGVSENAHILLLFAMPLAGALLDRGGRAARFFWAVLICAAFSAPAMVFITNLELREALYDALCMGRQAVFLATLLLADRLIRNRSRLPLLTALAYMMLPLAMAGNALSRLGGGMPLMGGLALLLAAVFSLLALRLRKALTAMPPARDEQDPSLFPLPEATLPAQPEPGKEAMPAPADPARLVAFATAYDLSERESLVMEMLAQHRSTDAIAEVLAVKESTVRTYVSRLMQKTGTNNRAVLLALFAAQKPAPDGTNPEVPA